jgi:hypothetical protein
MMIKQLTIHASWRAVVALMLLGFIILPTAGLSTVGQAAPGAPIPLAVIELANPEQLLALSELGLSVYLQLPKPDGGVTVLLPADEAAQTELNHLGIPFRIVESDSSQGGYYLVKLEGSVAEASLDMNKAVLDLGDHIVLQLDPKMAAQVSVSGVRLRPLPLVPYMAPTHPEHASQLEAVTANPLIQRMIGQVSQETLSQYVGDLSGEWPVTVSGAPYQFNTRNTWEYQPITKATRFAYEHFMSLGILADYHYYSFYGLERRNVLAQQTGISQPERIFLLIAHLDSISQAPATNAPGADDNASGSAAVMHIAEILEQYPFGCSLRYVLFTGEEEGLHGSIAYANRLANQGVDVVVVLNLDMLGYSPANGSPVIELHTRYSNETDLELAGIFDDIVSAYQLNLSPVILNDNLSFSDHYPFWQNGFPGILAIEDWSHHTPYYHTTNDRLSTLNMGYYTEFTKAALGTYAHIGCLQQGDLAGSVREAVGGAPIVGALVTVQSPQEEPWTANTGTDGSYAMPLFAGDYTVTVSATGYAGQEPVNAHIVDDTQTTVNFELQSLTMDVFLPFVVGSGT